MNLLLDQKTAIFQKIFLVWLVRRQFVMDVDGTLVQVKRPLYHKEQFVDRKRSSSLTKRNVGCWAASTSVHLLFSATWPGSPYDVKVLRLSDVYDVFEHGNFGPCCGTVSLW